MGLGVKNISATYFFLELLYDKEPNLLHIFKYTVAHTHTHIHVAVYYLRSSQEKIWYGKFEEFLW